MKIRVELPNFDAGARTIAELRGDGTFSFLVDAVSKGVVCGLASLDKTATPNDILFGFFISPTGCHTVEVGESDGPTLPWSASTLFEVVRVDGVVRYYLDGTLIGTAVATNHDVIFGDCSLFANGDAIIDATIDDAVAHEVNGGESTLGPIGAKGSDINIAVGFAGIGHLAVKAIPLNIVDLGKLWATGSETPGAHGIARIGPLAAWGSDRFVAGEYNFANLGLGPLWANGHDAEVTGPQKTIGVGWLGTAGADKPDAAYGFAGVGSIAVSGAMALSSWLRIVAPKTLVGFFATAGTESARLPVPIAIASGRSGSLAAALPVPIPSLIASASGEFAAVDLPVIVPELLASAVDGTGKPFAALPVVVPLASGLSTTMAAIRLPIAVPIAQGTASDTVSTFGQFPIVVPSIVARCDDEIVRAVLPVVIPDLEAGYLVPTRLPVIVPVATGHATDALPDGANRDALAALAVNLSHAGVSMPLYPGFDRLATIAGVVFGIAEGKLYRLKALPVHPFARLKTAQSELGTTARKRLDYLYAHGRLSQPVEVEIQYDENRRQRYRSVATFGNGSSVQRVKLGRGFEFWSASVALENRNGGSLNIGSLELLVQPLSKRTA